MTAQKRNSTKFVGGLIVLGCALVSIISGIADWAANGEKLKLGIAPVLLALGAMLVATSRRRSSIEKDESA